MLAVDRSRVPVPDDLDGSESRGGKEKTRAKEHHKAFDPETTKTFPFKAYKADSVKQALHELFHGKCAYCETFYAANAPPDVEHYRPKAAVIIGGESKRPGYWWLAAEWSNLLPSCIDCNRKRGQDLPDEEHAKVGKANAFPIADESKRWTIHDAEDEEVRLLLDPCRDDPAKVLRFGYDKKTKKTLVQLVDGVGALDRRIGDASIRVYGLNREGLRAARGDCWLRTRHQAKALSKAAKRFKATPDDHEVRQQLADELREVRTLRSEDRPYTAMVRQMVDPLLARVVALLEAKLAAELPPSVGEPVELVDRFLARFPESDGFEDF